MSVPVVYDYKGEPFETVDSGGDTFTLTPLYRLRTDTNGKKVKTYLAADCVALETAVGTAAIIKKKVPRDAMGRFALYDYETAKEGTQLQAVDPESGPL